MVEAGAGPQELIKQPWNLFDGRGGVRTLGPYLMVRVGVGSLSDGGGGGWCPGSLSCSESRG